MKKLFLLLALWAAPVSAEKLTLNELSNYLNQLKTAEGAFTQINGDGSITTGTLYIKRPGRMRFEYNPPEKALVIAGGGSLAVFDPKSNDGPARYPLNQTPLHIILERNVNLAKRDMVVAHVTDGTRTTVTAQDPDRPEYGFIQMVFTGNPVQLRQWVVDDNSGTQTTVILGEWKEGLRVPNRQFNILAAIESWQP